MRHRHLVIALLAVLAACERYEDTGRACVLPHEMECHVGDSESDTGLEYGRSATAGAKWCFESATPSRK